MTDVARFSSTFALLALVSSSAVAAPFLTESPKAGDFVLSADGNSAVLYVESGADKAVKRAVDDLAEDIGRVTGVRAQVTNNLPNQKKSLVIIGSLDNSKLIKRLAVDGKLDLDGIRGQWESFTLQVVNHPLPGVTRALVIAGSDRRGTIYGIYELSEAIGVSPWYWWADVPPKRKKLLAIHAGTFKRGPPAVKYRGIFLNDEDWGLRPWAAKTFEPETGNIGPKTYARIFELLLRLKANYLWPAMHSGTRAFNSDQQNQQLADEYGIVMGSSHCEQMLRNNVEEWPRDGRGEYNYATNRDGVLRYWEQRVRENAKFENIHTVGMRGIHDSGMPGGGTLEEQAARLHRIIGDQRELLQRWVNADVAKVPQILCPYKEVLALYRRSPEISPDITLVWPDDNFGYVRQYSNSQERQRNGGAGVYYHLSYWGAPRDYLWLYSTPPALIWEEMSKAWDYGARNVWVINVGDLKPAEIGTEFFLQLAWDPKRWSPQHVNDFLAAMAARDFSPDHAQEIAAIFEEYFRLNLQRKPEHMHIDPDDLIFSPVRNGDEIEQRLDAFHALVARADELAEKMPSAQRDAYYQLVLYPVRSAALMNEKWLNLARFYAYVKQGRASAANYLALAHRADDAIHRETDFYNSRLSGGKWRHMMSDNPHPQPVFGFPKVTPPTPPDETILKVAVEAGRNERELEFNALTRHRHFVDVFNGGTKPAHWTATTSAPWIRLSGKEGDTDTRVWLDIEWSRVPVGEDVRGTVRFAGTGQEIPVQISAYNPAPAQVPRTADFVEDGGWIVMEAEHASALRPGRDARWEIVRGLGYNGEAVSVFPTTVPLKSEPQEIRRASPRLEYHAWIRQPGEWNVTVRTSPTWSVEAGKPQRYAIGFDDDSPHIVSLPAYADEHDKQWQEDVLRNAALSTSTHVIRQPGLHTLNIWMVDPGIVIDAIIAHAGNSQQIGYIGPTETKVSERGLQQ